MPASNPTLRDMVQDAVDRGQTLEQLESNAVDPVTGKRASKSLFSRIKRGEVDRVPNDFHLRAIAAALGRPYELVRQAAIVQWLPAEDGAATDDESLLREMKRLADEGERIRQQAARLIERAEQQGAGEEPTERETA